MTIEELANTIDSIRVMNLKEGDALVFKTSAFVSGEMAQQIGDMIRKTLGQEIKVLVLDGGSELEIVRKEK